MLGLYLEVITRSERISKILEIVGDEIEQENGGVRIEVKLTQYLSRMTDSIRLRRGTTSSRTPVVRRYFMICRTREQSHQWKAVNDWIHHFEILFSTFFSSDNNQGNDSMRNYCLDVAMMECILSSISQRLIKRSNLIRDPRHLSTSFY